MSIDDMLPTAADLKKRIALEEARGAIQNMERGARGAIQNLEVEKEKVTAQLIDRIVPDRERQGGQVEHRTEDRRQAHEG